MSSSRRRPYVANQRVAIAAGVVSLGAAAFFFRDAWERRGRARPTLASWLGV